MILALGRFALLIISALQPAGGIEKNRLTRRCQKTGAARGRPPTCLEAQVELRALLLGTNVGGPESREAGRSLPW